MQLALIIAIFAAAAVVIYRRTRGRHRTTELHTLTPREVADNCRPHGAHITIAPARDPRGTTHNPVE
jgi:hypothetical protein